MPEQFTPSAGEESTEKSNLTKLMREGFEQMKDAYNTDDEYLKGALSKKFPDYNEEQLNEEVLKAKERLRNGNTVSGEKTLNSGDELGDIGREIGDSLINIKGKEVVNMLQEGFNNAKEEQEELLKKAQVIEKVAPGFTDNLLDIHNDLQLAMDLEEDSPSKKAVEKYLRRSPDFPLQSVLEQVENGGSKEIVINALSDYLEDINGALKRADIQPLDTKILD